MLEASSAGAPHLPPCHPPHLPQPPHHALAGANLTSFLPHLPQPPPYALAGAALIPGFYCLNGYDIQGGSAGANSNLAAGTASSCASSCAAFSGCEAFVLSDKCYLKTLDGPYGTTGPSPTVANACFNGQGTWQQFGNVLDYILPQVGPSSTAALVSIALAMSHVFERRRGAAHSLARIPETRPL